MESFGTLCCSCLALQSSRFHESWCPCVFQNSLLAEVGTFQLEFRYLSHVAAESKYAQTVGFDGSG